MTRLGPADARAALAGRATGVWHPLPEAALVAVTGADAARYLQAMTTQDLAGLPPGGCAYAALADERGRYVADFWVWRPGGAWMLEVAAGLAETVAARLARFAVADEVEVALARDRVLFHAEGPGAAAAVRRMGAPEEAAAVTEVAAGGHAVWLARRSRHGEAGFTLAVPAAAAAGVAERLAAAAGSAGLEPAGPAAREALRLEAGRALGGVDVTAADLIQEAGLGAAVALAKGCFPGQEILRRVARQGALRRRLGGIVLGRDAEPAPGDPVEDDAGRRLGAITSAAESPALGAVVALAWLAEPAWSPGAPVRVRTAAGLFAGRVSGLPFVSGAAGPLAETPAYPERTATRP